MDNFKKRSEYIPYTPRYVFPEDSEEERIAALVDAFFDANYAEQRLSQKHERKVCIFVDNERPAGSVCKLMSQVSGVPVDEVPNRVQEIFAVDGLFESMRKWSVDAEYRELMIINDLVEKIKQYGKLDIQEDETFLWEYVDDSVVILYTRE